MKKRLTLFLCLMIFFSCDDDRFGDGGSENPSLELGNLARADILDARSIFIAQDSGNSRGEKKVKLMKENDKSQTSEVALLDSEGNSVQISIEPIDILDLGEDILITFTDAAFSKQYNLFVNKGSGDIYVFTQDTDTYCSYIHSDSNVKIIDGNKNYIALIGTPNEDSSLKDFWVIDKADYSAYTLGALSKFIANSLTIKLSEDGYLWCNGFGNEEHMSIDIKFIDIKSRTVVNDDGGVPNLPPMFIGNKKYTVLDHLEEIVFENNSYSTQTVCKEFDCHNYKLIENEIVGFSSAFSSSGTKFCKYNFDSGDYSEKIVTDDQLSYFSLEGQQVGKRVLFTGSDKVLIYDYDLMHLVTIIDYSDLNLFNSSYDATAETKSRIIFKEENVVIVNGKNYYGEIVLATYTIGEDGSLSKNVKKSSPEESEQIFKLIKLN